MNKQPEALRLADDFEIYAADHEPDGWPAVKQKHLTAAAVELRRLHEVNQELLEALKLGLEIGDGMPRGFLGEFQKYARAAIAKAGEQP